MKKILLTLTAIAGLTASGFSQDYKPTAGMSSLEVTFDPSSIFNANNGGPTFALPSIYNLNQGLKYRNWMSSNVATRGTFLLGFRNISNPIVLQNSAGENVDANTSYFEWAVQIKPGIERHFAGTDRLSPYMGAELILGYGSNKYTTESLDASDAIVESYVKNGTQDFVGNNLPWTYVNGFTAGIGLLAGFDYYVAKDLYLGLELGYSFAYNKRAAVKTKQAGADEVETKTGSNVFFQPAAGANLRLGWNF